MPSAKEKAWMFGAFAYGALAQSAAEVSNIAFNTKPHEYPDGINSLNVPEEIFEGGVAAVTGAIIVRYLYLCYCHRFNQEYSEEKATKALIVGSVWGYFMMSAIAGPILHEVLNVQDVNWGPFSSPSP